jgi:hypothetical protein
MKNTITVFIREILRVQPEPPRQVKYIDVLRVVFKEKSMKFVFIFGLIITLPFFLVSSNVKISDRILFAFFGLFTSLIAVAPFYYARRIFNAIKIGRVLSAKVESVKYTQSSPNTLNSTENGFAQGTWRLPEGELVNFEIDQSWAKDIKVGSNVEVIVVRPKFNSVYPLGLHE